MLAGTADIVFIVDESESSDVNQQGVGLLHEWVADVAVELDRKLEGRGIEGNRFFLTAFGGELDTGEQYDVDYLVDEPAPTFGAPRQVDLDYDNDDYESETCDVQRFGTSQEFYDSIVTQDSLQSGEGFAGSTEDAWWGIHQAAKGIDGTREFDSGGNQFTAMCGGPDDTDGFVDTLYEFRKNAAVHFVVVTDEPSDPRVRDATEGEFEATLEDMLDILEQQSLRDENGLPNQIADAVITAIVPAMFSISGITDPIMGVDADVFDRWDVDVDAYIPSAATFDHQAHVFVDKGNDDIDVVTTNQDFLASYWLAGSPETIQQQDIHYVNDVLRILDDPNVDYLDNNHTQGTQVDHLAQRHFFGERNAFLAWETGGTVWDVEYAIGELLDGQSPMSADEIRESGDIFFEFSSQDRAGTTSNPFTQSVVDDIIEKIRLQTVNLDGTGGIALDDEIPDFWSAAIEVRDNPTSHNVNIDKYDIDGDGTFVDTSTGEIDAGDITRLIKILGTHLGDSNFDFEFSSADQVVVFGVNEYDDNDEDNSTWAEGDWNGDFDFDSSDFVFAFAAGSYEEGYLDDIDNYFGDGFTDADDDDVPDPDGKPDVLPYWAIEVTFSGSITFYLPTWGS